eukprot:TRINITY_DN217_c0_g1_i2.p1 TRINITY_DN217_c0_g1~~TRINITY_DN217_c0_g1_i2.p1  ORF type:complete len:198 (-),score=50.13 TRINITY_DN217_c0_g1_i2:41-634(-)
MSLLYGSIVEFCTDETCPIMSAGEHQYLWADGVQIKKPISATAPQYVDYLMAWVDGIINDEAVFPTGKDMPFPKNFVTIVKTIFKRLFRVYAHIYHSHFEQIKSIGADGHLNTCFKHFIFFIDEFRLVDDQDLEPLKDLIQMRLSEDPTLSERSNANAILDVPYPASAKTSMDASAMQAMMKEAAALYEMEQAKANK